MYFHVGASDYGTSRWCNSHKVSKHRACMSVQMHGVARSTVDFSKWWIGISVFCPFYSQGLRIRFGSLAVCANSRSDLRHLDFSVMINWNGSMMSCIWMARCMASFLGQKLLESFVLPSRYDSWTLAYWKSLRRDDASPAFRVLSGSVNEWVEVHWSNCYRRELLAYFQDLVGCIWERNIEAFPVLFLNDSCVVWATRDIKKQIASCLECLDIWIGNPAQLPKLRFGCVYNWNPRWKHLSCLLFLFFLTFFTAFAVCSIRNEIKLIYIVWIMLSFSFSFIMIHH